MKAIFLDKDGTLVDNLPYNVDPARIALSIGAGAGLRIFAQLGYRLFVVSNQAGVARGYFSEAALAPVADRLAVLLDREQVALQGFYYCPHHPDGISAPYRCECACRKPMPGMLLQAAAEHALTLSRCWMIGDILHDVEAGNRAGCKTILIDNGNETEWEMSTLRQPDFIAPDLYAAALLVAHEDREAGRRRLQNAR